MPAVQRLLSESDLDALLAASARQPVLVFKHSTT